MMMQRWRGPVGVRVKVLFLLAAGLGTWVQPGLGQSRYGNGFTGTEGAIAREMSWRRALRVEREVLVLDAWAEAGPDARKQMEARLVANIDPRHSHNRPLPMANLSAAWRGWVNAGEDPERLSWLDLLDSVDLRVVPGAFQARSEGRGEPMTVKLTSLWNSRFDETLDVPLEVRLLWISPQGVETVARHESATAANMEAGFDMYIRPPISAPGVWRLTLELVTPLGVLRSIAVPVECVSDLPALRARLSSGVEGETAFLGRAFLGRLQGLLDHGLRRANTMTLASWVEFLEGKKATPGSLQALDGAGLGVPGETFWQLSEGPNSSGTLLLLAKRDEAPSDIFYGLRLAAWRELSKACDLRILAGHVPFDADSVEALDRCLTALRKSDAEQRLFLVARGESGQVLPPLLGQLSPNVLDGLVLSETLGAGARVSDSLPFSVLQIVSGRNAQDAPVSDEGQGRTRRTLNRVLAPEPMAGYQSTALLSAWIRSL